MQTVVAIEPAQQSLRLGSLEAELNRIDTAILAAAKGKARRAVQMHEIHVMGACELEHVAQRAGVPSRAPEEGRLDATGLEPLGDRVAGREGAQ